MFIISLFCNIDDFFNVYKKYKASQQLPVDRPLETRGRPRTLHPKSDYRTLKAFYEKHARHYLRWAFPNLVSYSRFVELQQEVLEPLSIYIYTRFGICDGISFVDSTPVPVCHNRRNPTHKVFVEQASLSKNSVG